MLKNGLSLLSKTLSIIFLSTLNVTLAQEVNVEQGVELLSYKQCGSNDKSRILAKMVVNDGSQLRKKLSCNALLSELAQKKAEEMAASGEVTHYGPNGSPDKRLMDGGYNLDIPSSATGLNHVEAILGGYSNPEVVLDNFKNSFHHRVHLFAEHDFFLNQDDIGVGYAYNWNSPHVDYWVIYIANDKEYGIEQRLSSQPQDKSDVLLVTKPMK